MDWLRLNLMSETVISYVIVVKGVGLSCRFFLARVTLSMVGGQQKAGEIWFLWIHESWRMHPITHVGRQTRIR